MKILPAAFAVLLCCAAAAAQQTETLPTLKARIAAEQPRRDLSRLNVDELERLQASPGGVSGNLWSPEFVLKVGSSTFIVNMRRISAVAAVCAAVVLLYFTPLGFVLFRGRAHTLLGNILAGTGLAREFGEHLKREPKLCLSRAGGARMAFVMYMRSHFIAEYKNNVTAAAFLGTAFLIMVIGLRGIKFLTPHQPDLVIIAIMVEMSVLCLLGLTTWYEKSGSPAGTTAVAVETIGELSFDQFKQTLLQFIDEWETRQRAAQGPGAATAGFTGRSTSDLFGSGRERS